MPSLLKGNGSRRKFGRMPFELLGKPRARMQNGNTGIPEVAVLRVFDIYAVQQASAMGKLKLFSLPQGAQYNFNGVTSFAKGPQHTSILQAGMLESSYSYVVRALSITIMGLQGNALALPNPTDIANYLTSFHQFNINRKAYMEGPGLFIPGGNSVYANGSFTAPAGVASNGFPMAQNVYDLPGGQFINPQENFDWIVDPTQNAGGTPVAVTTAPNAYGAGNGLMAWHSLDGTLERVAQ
jgi:hypothetical protein